REFGIVLLFLRMEAHVFEEDDVAGLHPPQGLLDRRSHALGDEGDGPAEQLAEPLRDRREGESRIDAARAAEVRDEPDRGATLDQRTDRRKRRTDAGVVSDGGLAARRARLAERHVELDANEDALAARVDFADGPLVEPHAGLSGRRRQARAASTRRTR